MKNYQRGFLVPLIWGFVVLLALGLGTYAYIRRTQNAQVVSRMIIVRRLLILWQRYKMLLLQTLIGTPTIFPNAVLPSQLRMENN